MAKTATTKTFGSELRKLRKESNLTLRQFAKKVGTSATAVCSVERGYRTPPQSEKLRKWLGALNVGDREQELFVLADKTRPRISVRQIAERNKEHTEILSQYESGGFTDKQLHHLRRAVKAS